MSRTNPMATISVHTMKNKQQAEVFTQPTDADDPFIMVFILWSDKLTRISDRTFELNQATDAKAYAAKVNKLGYIEDSRWNKCAPNTKERTNPLFPAHHVYDYSAQESA